MAKYHELVEEYEDWIEGIKADQAEWQQAKAEFEAAQAAGDFDAWAERAEELGYLGDEIAESRAALTARIREEYDSVPFRATRQAGIAGFWREAGLRPLG